MIYKIHILPDGTKIEVTTSDTYSGPDGKPGCQRTSKNMDWIKINDGRWEPSSFRSSWKLLEWLQLCENLADFLSYND